MGYLKECSQKPFNVVNFFNIVQNGGYFHVFKENLKVYICKVYTLTWKPVIWPIVILNMLINNTIT